MNKELNKKINKKHLLVVGKSPKERNEFVSEIINNTSKVIYRFPPNLQNFYEYIDQVRRLFPFIPENWHEQNPKKWTANQVWDFHLDWTENTHSILIVLEEFGQMEKDWKIEFIRGYLKTSYYQEKPDNSIMNFQLIVTMQDGGELIEQICSVFDLEEKEKRTPEQVVKGKLEVIDLDLI